MASPKEGSLRRQKGPAAEKIMHNVSRNSGLHGDVGTFGGAGRFNQKTAGHGVCSPDGRDFYKNSQLFKSSLEKGAEYSFGIGARPEMLSRKVPRNVGPGSYDIVASAAKRRSPLDGPEFCTTRIHGKLPSKLVPADMCSPGPHHKYEVRKPLDHDRPSFGSPTLGRNARHEFPEDRDTPGPGSYPMQHHQSTARAASCPGFRTVRSTFGMADRFRGGGAPNSSPDGAYYYSHYKPKEADDYLAGSRSCTFGKSGKIDLANPYGGPRFQVSPVSYSPCTSIAYKTSALDGLTSRLESPIKASTKGTASKKQAKSSGGPGGGVRGGAKKESGNADATAAA
mmetsp:Transcript_41215/g.116618  ORF Transcript_41215/g.116618 Transcript_41215/m.116618 type:complete len:339 (+) Transcript_41215:50-1066(+)